MLSRFCLNFETVWADHVGVTNHSKTLLLEAAKDYGTIPSQKAFTSLAILHVTHHVDTPPGHFESHRSPRA